MWGCDRPRISVLAAVMLAGLLTACSAGGDFTGAAGPTQTSAPQPPASVDDGDGDLEVGTPAPGQVATTTAPTLATTTTTAPTATTTTSTAPAPAPPTALPTTISPPTTTTTTPPTPTSRVGFRVLKVTLTADPTAYAGSCPTTITFSGQITVAGGSGKVSYTFLRSDGASAPVTTVTFDEPGSVDVGTTWTLGGSDFSYSGWQAVRILSPQRVDSDKAEFTVKCAAK